MRKFCTTCLIEKPIESFSWKSKAKKTQSSKCKECTQEYSKVHYINNIEKYKAKTRKSNASAISRNKMFLWEYLISHPCVDCGEIDPVVLEFDHVRGKTKNISSLISSSISAIEKELKLCDIRCSNCHTRRTAQMYGWRISPTSQ